MAASIEEIFQDFILNKIRELEGHHEGQSGVEGLCSRTKFAATETDKEDEISSHCVQKKHKKHKKHKKKKRKRVKADKESSSESGAESYDETNHVSRRGSTGDTKKDQGEDPAKSSGLKRSSSGKKKKKRKRSEDDIKKLSDSDLEFVSNHMLQQYNCGSLSAQQDILPDIIPKQDYSIKGRGDVKSHGRMRCLSYSQSHKSSCSQARPSCATKMESLDDSKPSVSPVMASSPRLSCMMPKTNENDKVLKMYEENVQATTEKLESDQTTAPNLPHLNASEDTKSMSAAYTQSSRMMLKPPKLPQNKKEGKSSKKHSRTKSPHRSHRRRSRTRSPDRKKRSTPRSRSRSCSVLREKRRDRHRQKDHWKEQPSHSPVLIPHRSSGRKYNSSNSPQRISELDKDQLLEIAKANVAAMCARAGMTIPVSLRSSTLPLTVPAVTMNPAMASMTAATMTAALSNLGTLSSFLTMWPITNNPASSVAAQTNMAALEEMKRKKCKMIVDSKGELPVAMPHISDEEEDGRPFGGSALRDQKAITFNINSTSVRPSVRADVGIAKEFPVSSGSHHRKKEGEALEAYGQWIPVDRSAKKEVTATHKAVTPLSEATATLSSMDTKPTTELRTAVKHPMFVLENDSIFPEPPLQAVDISQAVNERIKAQRCLAENPYDVSAICMLSRAQEQVNAWAQSTTIPGLFTGSTGAQVLSSEDLSTSGPQAWLKKDQFLRAAPVSGGVGEFLMRKMGWKMGEGLGRNREGTVEPIIVDFKVDRKGLLAEGEKPQKQTGGLVVTKDLMGKHPVSALIELCTKRKLMQPDFVMIHHSGPDHRKSFLFKVTVNGVDYQPQAASPSKKHAKAMAATVALQALGEVPADGPGLYTGPVFTAASTGPLFST
ncbi:protein SON isoform X2 [Thalassophryne amazonica]|uniref:protein SON isoform X2 n=1 Tax=Thalassophryne amazonica TaxID=390379 RepID=UPI001471BFDA|nr:protein SON isoform X2 [Thalassophryne amazonica]